MENKSKTHIKHSIYNSNSSNSSIDYIQDSNNTTNKVDTVLT